MQEKTAREIYELLKLEGIVQKQGSLVFYLQDEAIRMPFKDLVGPCLKKWFMQWMDQHQIYYYQPENVPQFPDFYLSKDPNQKNMLEFKTFCRQKQVIFDLGNYDTYIKEILEDPNYLDLCYLIIGYDVHPDGTVTFPEIWIRNIWEIAGKTDYSPLKISHNYGCADYLRPSLHFQSCQAFANEQDFLRAIYRFEVMRHSAEVGEHWKSEMEVSYYKLRGKILELD
jgi:hypothetical protein